MRKICRKLTVQAHGIKNNNLALSRGSLPRLLYRQMCSYDEVNRCQKLFSDAV
uniref:Uncharacterized protein n=1 Tax=Arion vulgaris TaxID=1028688 RepID=A0A0B7AH67_9EUPU